MMQTSAWMAYSNSTHSSEQLSYITFLIWICRLKDMDIVRFAKEINKIKDLAYIAIGGIRTWADQGKVGTATGLQLVM